MADFLEIDLKGFVGNENFLKQIKEALLPDEVADEAGAILLNRIRTRFLDEETPDGERWIESRAAKSRRSSGRGGGTLFDSGTLFHSIQLFKRGTGVRAIATDVPYAKDHQLGQNGNLRREFLGFGAEDTNVVKRLVIARLDKVKRNE